MTDKTFDECVEELIEDIKYDYDQYLTERNMDILREKGEPIVKPEGGRKYLKISFSDADGRGTRVWGFIVTADTDKFKQGDILKSKNWHAPATNSARGNIFTDYVIEWTGPLYHGDKRMVGIGE